MKEPNNFEKYVTAKPNATNLKAMALQQQNQIESQHQLLSAKEQRLRFLKVHEINISAHDHENEHLQRLRERVEAQESKLRRLRALRGQVDLQKTYNVSIGNDLDSIRALFSEKEKELSLAVAKVEALTKQLEELRRDRREPYSLLTSNTNGVTHELSIPSAWATKELEKLRKELLHRNQLSLQQDAKLNLQREALQLRQAELRSVDQRIFELQTRLQKKKASNLILQRNHKHQLTNTNYSEIINSFSGPVKLSNNINSTQRMILRGNVAAIEPYVHNPEKAIVTPTNIQLHKKQSQMVQGISNSNDNYNGRIINGNIHNNTRSECDENKLARQKLYPTQFPGYDMLIPDDSNNKLNGYYSGNNYNGYNRITCDDSIIMNSNKDKYKTIPSINYATKVNYKLTKSVSSGAIPHHIFATDNDGNTHNDNSNDKENGYAYGDDNDTDDDDDDDIADDDDDDDDNDGENNNPYEHSKVDQKRQDSNNNNIDDTDHVMYDDTKNRNVDAVSDADVIENDINYNDGIGKKKDIYNSEIIPTHFTNNDSSLLGTDHEPKIKYKEPESITKTTTNQSLKFNTLHTAIGHKQQSATVRNTTLNGMHTSTGTAATNLKNDNKNLVTSKGLKSFSISSGNSVVPPRKPISSVAPTTVNTISKLSHGSKVNLVSPSINVTAITSMVTVTTSSVSSTSSLLPLQSSGLDILKPCLPPKPPNKQPLEFDTKNNTTIHNSCIPTIVNVISKPTVSDMGLLPPTDDNENDKSNACSPIVDNLPIKARPLTIKKQPLSEQPRLRSISSGIKPIQYSSRRIEIPPAFLFPKVNETAYSVNDDDDDNDNGVAEEPIEGGTTHTIPIPIINKENTDDIPINVNTDNNAGKPEKSATIIRRNRSSINYDHGKTNLTRRVSFDPLALLLDASLEGELELVKKTTMQVPNPSAANDEGITALHNSICAGHFEIVKYLVEYGCDVNAQDSDGWTPLHCAASCNNLSMVKFLVETGACLFATTLSDQETPAEKCEEDEEGFDGCSEYLYSVQEKLGILNRGEVYAVFSYDSQQSDELSFEVNEQLTIVRKGDEAEREWWWAQSLTGKEGYVPRNLLGLYPRIPLQSSNFTD